MIQTVESNHVNDLKPSELNSIISFESLKEITGKIGGNHERNWENHVNLRKQCEQFKGAR